MKMIAYLASHSWILGFILTSTGIMFNAKKNIACWPVWIAANVCWLVYAFNQDQGPYVAITFLYLATNIYGWYEWKKKK